MKKNPDKNSFEAVVQAAKGVRLSSEARERIQDNLVYFTRNHPVRNLALERQTSERSLLIKFKFMPIALAVMLLFGGSGVTFAAQGSLPGDLLYPVKTLSENVRVGLAFSDEAKAQVNAKLASRRLEEAEKLVVEGRLNAETKDQIEASFEAHSAEANKAIVQLEVEGNLAAAADANAELVGSLNAHNELLGKLGVKAEASGSENASASPAQNLSVTVGAKVEAQKALGAELETKVSAESNGEVKNSVQGRLNAAENELVSLRAYLETRKDKVSAEVYASAEADANAAADLLASVSVKIGAGAYGDAFVIILKAEVEMQNTRFVIQSSENFNINLAPSRVEGQTDFRINNGSGATNPPSGSNDADGGSLNFNTGAAIHGGSINGDGKVDVRAGGDSFNSNDSASIHGGSVSGEVNGNAEVQPGINSSVDAKLKLGL